MNLRVAPRRERRRHPRAITNFRASVLVGERSFSARVINLSLGGALLDLGAKATARPVEVGDSLTLAIRHSVGPEPLLLAGRVVLWNSSTSARAPLLAIQFGEISCEDGEVLEELLVGALAVLWDMALEANS